MQFDTICYGCYEPYGDGTVPWENLIYGYDFPNPAFLHPIPTDHLPRGTMVDPFGGVGSNAGNLCEGRDANTVDYYTTLKFWMCWRGCRPMAARIWLKVSYGDWRCWGSTPQMLRPAPGLKPATATLRPITATGANRPDGL